MINYSPLWATMKQRGVTTYDLIVTYNMSKGTLHKLKHNGNTTLLTLEYLCYILECDVADIATITLSEDEKNSYYKNYSQKTSHKLS